MENSINKEPQPSVAEVTDAYLNVQEILIEVCHKYDIARDDQLKLYRTVFNLAAQNKWWSMIIDTSGFETFQMFMFGYVGLIVVLSVWKHIEDILGWWLKRCL